MGLVLWPGRLVNLAATATANNKLCKKNDRNMKKAYLGIKYHSDHRNKQTIDIISSILEKCEYSVTCITRDIEKWGKVQFSPTDLMIETFKIIEYTYNADEVGQSFCMIKISENRSSLWKFSVDIAMPSAYGCQYASSYSEHDIFCLRPRYYIPHVSMIGDFFNYF